MRISTLKRRAEFQRVRGGGRWATRSFVMEGKRRPEAADGAGPRFGFTLTKKLGGAVVRNRMRRRLRAAIAELAESSADAHFDYVVIAREASLDQPYVDLRKDLATAFAQIARTADRPGKSSHQSRHKAPAKQPSGK